MTVIAFPTPRAPRPAHDDTLRADCERLMRRLVRDGTTPHSELQLLADVLDQIIARIEAKGEAK